MLELQPANKPLFIIYELANCSSLTWNKGLPHFEIEKDLSDCKIAIVLCDHPSEVICRLPQMPVRIRVKLHQNNIRANYPVLLKHGMCCARWVWCFISRNCWLESLHFVICNLNTSKPRPGLAKIPEWARRVQLCRPGECQSLPKTKIHSS